MAKTNFTTPVGRLVAGSLIKPNSTDAEGRPLVHKSGPDMGKPRSDYFFALAIPKGPEQHWSQTEWGAKIWAAGCAFLAHAPQLPGFAWKVSDGDSQVPNKRGRRPCDNEGWSGCWVLKYSSGFAPRCYSLVGSRTPAAVDASAIGLGDYVQVNGDVDGNASTSQPGVYLNHGMVCLIGYGQRIVVGPDVDSAGFGADALPAGASLTPPGGFVAPPAPVAAALPPAPVAAALPPAPVAVVPNPAFLQVPPAPVRRMTAAAQGATYEQMIAAGWTDDLLRQHGMVEA